VKYKTQPQRIVCLTEESVETLYLLGQEKMIVGVSAYVKRPKQAQKLPKVSAFIKSNIKKISKINPDLVLGFSDIQKDIARDLIEAGLNVYIANQRSLAEILEYVIWLGSTVGERRKAMALARQFDRKLEQVRQKTARWKRKPRVYFEEWDEPMIAGIQWVSQLIEACGGIDVNARLSSGKLARDRFVTSEAMIKKNPDIVIGCWCGKKVNIASIRKRPGWASVNAIRQNNIVEVEPEIFLQPGPAPFLDGIDILLELFERWRETQV